MQKPSEYNPQLSTAIILQGPPGSGKTTLACMFPGVYVCDFDMNLRGTLKYLERNNLPPIQGFDTIDIDENGKEVPEQARFKRFNECIKEVVKHPEIETIVLDGATKLGQYILVEVLRQAGKSETSFKTWADYLYLWRSTMTKLRTTGKMIVLTAHERVEKDEIDGMNKYFLHLPGQIASELAGFMTDCWRCEVDEKAGAHTWNLRTLPNQKFQLKNTMNMPAKLVANPKDLKKFLDDLAYKPKTSVTTAEEKK